MQIIIMIRLCHNKRQKASFNASMGLLCHIRASLCHVKHSDGAVPSYLTVSSLLSAFSRDLYFFTFFFRTFVGS